MKNSERIPNWLILDVEGFGADVISGATEIISKYYPNIAVEIHCDQEHEKIENTLMPLGYEKKHNFNGGWGKHIIWIKRK